MQFEINARLLVDLQNDILLLGRAEALGVRPNCVRRGTQTRENVRAMLVRLRGRRNTGGVVGNSDGRLRHHGPALVLYYASDLARIAGLAVRHHRWKHEGKEENDRVPPGKVTADTHGKPPGRDFHIISS